MRSVDGTSAGMPCLFEVGVGVSICGLTIWPGELLHGDENSLPSKPISIADKLAAQAQKVIQYERDKEEFMKATDFTPDSYVAKYGW